MESKGCSFKGPLSLALLTCLSACPSVLVTGIPTRLPVYPSAVPWPVLCLLAHLSAFVPDYSPASFLFACPSLYMSASLPASLAAPCSSPAHPFRLTAIVVQGGELGGLVAAASAVASPHAQLVPRGLSQLGQKHLPGPVGAQALPGPGALGPVLQHDGCDRAAPVAPALQVKPSMCGVDVGEEVLVFAEGGLWGARGRERG